MNVSIKVNGVVQQAAVEPRLLLADFLRDQLGLTGTKVGCETGECGACTVLLNGAATKSCLALAVQADGGAVTTIEGLAPAATRSAALPCLFALRRVESFSAAVSR